MSKQINHLIVQEDDVRQFARFDKDLEKITLQFNVKDNLETIVESIPEHLKSYTKLTQLNLFIEGCQSYESLHFKLIYDLLNSTKLQELTINTGLSNNFGDEAAVHLSNNLQSQTELQSLTLKLEPYNTLTEKGLNLILQSLTNLKKLTSFQFYLEEDNKANASSLALLGQVLIKNPKLSYLHLQFGSDTVTEPQGWIELGSKLQELRDLTTMVLCVGQNNHVGNEGIHSLYKGVGAQKHLEVFRLKIACHNDMKDGVLSYAGECFKSTTHLKQLRFRISEWNSLSDEALKQFSEGLMHLTQLKQIHLQLGHLTNFTQEGTTVLADALQHLTALNQMDLQIGSKYQFNGSAIQALANSVSKMKDLETFKLNIEYMNINLSLSSGNEATSSSLFQLGQSVGMLQNLKEVKINYSDPDSCSGEMLLDIIAPITKSPSLQDMLLTVGETERIHLRPNKQLTFSFKSTITTQGVKKFQMALQNLGQTIQKVKIDARDMALELEDIEKLKIKNCNLLSVTNLKIKLKKVKQLSAVGYLDLFEDYLKNEGLQHVSIDVGEKFKSQYIRPQEQKKISKKQKQEGAQLLIQIDAENKIGLEGEKLINRIISSQRLLIKEMNLKIGQDNELTKKGLEELAHTLSTCSYLSKLNFDVTDTSEELKTILPKLKVCLEQNITDKKNIINTYYSVTAKQLELNSTQISSDMLNDVSTYLMKTDGTEKLAPLVSAIGAFPIQQQLGGLFQSNQAAHSYSSFNDDQDDGGVDDLDTEQYNVGQYGEEEE